MWRRGSFAVPSGYFGASRQAILSEAKLDAFRDRSSFDVPDGYFDHLTRDVLAKTANKRTASGFPFRTERWVRYAAAACVAIASAWGIYTSTLDRSVPGGRLASIPEEEIIHYLASSTGSGDLAYIAEYLYLSQDSDNLGQHIDDEDIADYLNHTL